MKSATSCSDRRLFYPVLWKKNMARFWPIWSVYGACWLLALPLNLLMLRAEDTYGSMPSPQYFADLEVLSMIKPGSVIAALVFGILSAMAVFSYLYNSRSVGLFHALPVRREGLFLTNYLSGLSFMLLPSLVVFSCTLLAELAKGCLNIGALCMWLAMQVLLTLFFYSFAVFCAMFTGHILALPAFYGILSVLAVVMVQLVNEVLRAFVFGYRYVDTLNTLGTWLSPVILFLEKLRVDRAWDTDGNLERAVFQGLGYGLIYALIGAALAAVALVLYRRRHLEGAGDVVTVRWVRPIFKYGMAFCFALALGLFLYQFFGYNLPQGAWTLLCFMVLCGAVGYFAAEMLLKKSFWVFLDSWKGCVAFSACLVVLIAGMELDVTGFERRVPEAGQVTAVRIRNVSSAPYDRGDGREIHTADPELIRAITELHQSIVDERARHEGTTFGGSYETRTLADGTYLESVQTEGIVSLLLTYELAGGGTLTRDYTLDVTEEDLQDPDSAAARLTAILNQPEVILNAYFPQSYEGRQITNIRLNLMDMETGEYDNYPVPAGFREDLVAAIKADIQAGRLGQRYLLDDEARLTNCYVNDLFIEYAPVDRENSAEYEGDGYSITLQVSAVETLECLREAGVLDETHILETQAEHQQTEWLERRAEELFWEENMRMAPAAAEQ